MGEVEAEAEEVMEAPKVANIATETDYLRPLLCSQEKGGRMDLASGEGRTASVIDDHGVNHFETMLMAGRSTARYH